MKVPWEDKLPCAALALLVLGALRAGIVLLCI